MSPFEAVMICCFGASWPFSIYKSYRNKSVKGKSLLFLVLVFVGYVSGVVHKVTFAMDGVIVLYVLNAAMVFVDIVLFLKYRERTASLPSTE